MEQTWPCQIYFITTGFALQLGSVMQAPTCNPRYVPIMNVPMMNFNNPSLPFPVSKYRLRVPGPQQLVGLKHKDHLESKQHSNDVDWDEELSDSEPDERKDGSIAEKRSYQPRHVRRRPMSVS